MSQVRKNAIKSTGLSDEQTNRIIAPLEGVYLIIDHIRTLIFAISDGALPSNVGGGYNLRIMLRRIVSTMDRLKFKFDLGEIIDIQIDYLKNTYPELENGFASTTGKAADGPSDVEATSEVSVVVSMAMA